MDHLQKQPPSIRQSRIPCTKNRFNKLTLTKNKKPQEFVKEAPLKVSTPERTSDSVFKNARPGVGIQKPPPPANTISNYSTERDKSAPTRLSHSSLLSEDESEKENSIKSVENVLLKTDTDETHCSKLDFIKKSNVPDADDGLDTTVSESLTSEINWDVLSEKVQSLDIRDPNFRQSVADRDTVVDEVIYDDVPERDVQEDASESEASVICLSDSNDDTSDAYYPVSAINTQRSSIASSVMRRVDNFFENIPIADSSSGKESMIESSFIEAPSRHIEPVCISETSTEISADPVPDALNPIVAVHHVEATPENSINSNEVSRENSSFLGKPVVESSAKEDGSVEDIHLPSESSLADDNNVVESSDDDDPKVSRPSSESINISAHIKINIHISNGSVKTSRSEANSPATTPRSSKKTKDSLQHLSDSPVESGSNNQRLHRTPSSDPKTPTEAGIIDEEAQALLDALYGDQWKTPDILKHCSTTKKKPKRIQPVTFPTNDEFQSFKRNIQQDLESTRVGSNKKDEVRSPYFAKPSSDKRPQRRAAAVPVNFAGLCDSDTSSDEYNIDDDEEEPVKLPNSRKEPSKDNIVYLDLSKDTISFVEDHTIPEADESVLLELRKKNFDQFKIPEKPLMPATPTEKAVETPKVKTKRKLFTPRYNEIVIDPKLMDECPKTPPKRDLFEIDSNCKDEVKLKGALPKFFMAKRLLDKYDTPAKPGAPERAKSSPKQSPRTPAAKCVTPPPGKTQTTPGDKFGFLQSLDVSISKIMCHPDALYYRENYKTKKVELMNKLYDLYNLKVFNNELIIKISWNKKLLTTAGRCMNKKTNGERISRVELSEKVLTSADRLRCTLIHELCHAAAWVFDEENGHGAAWKRWARKSNTVFSELPKINVCHQYDIEYKYTYMCKVCNAKSYAHSKSKKVENIRCSYCHGGIEIFLNKKDKEGNTVHTPVRGASGFAKFVKEKYNKLKKPALSHAEVMRLLSTEFGSLSVDEKKKY